MYLSPQARGQSARGNTVPANPGHPCHDVGSTCIGGQGAWGRCALML